MVTITLTLEVSGIGTLWAKVEIKFGRHQWRPGRGVQSSLLGMAVAEATCYSSMLVSWPCPWPCLCSKWHWTLQCALILTMLMASKPFHFYFECNTTPIWFSFSGTIFGHFAGHCIGVQVLYIYKPRLRLPEKGAVLAFFLHRIRFQTAVRKVQNQGQPASSSGHFITSCL